jgi:hypothetical protein
MNAEVFFAGYNLNMHYRYAESEERKNVSPAPETSFTEICGHCLSYSPGAGQVYNKKYWKVPIVYAGLATAGYFIYYNYTVYTKLQNGFDLRADGDTATNLGSVTIWQVFNTQNHLPL